LQPVFLRAIFAILPWKGAKTMALELVVVPCRTDNYAYLVHDPASGETAVIDVPDAKPIMAELGARGWSLNDIWITHHHDDHISGVAELRAGTGAMVLGAAADAHRLPPLDLALEESTSFSIGALSVRVIDVPGHTVGHIAFHIPEAGLAFTADSLMAAGCGRMFEGNAPDYWRSLQKIAALPPDTLICSGHEYTISNLRFAQSLEPDNPSLIFRSARVAALRAEGKPSVPVTLAEELATNPFLRAGSPGLKNALGMAHATDVEVFAATRARKDRF
jgi:hydroxyacylglutathione hydrolase